MAEEKKMFIPASKFEAKPTKKINMTPPLPAVDEQEELEELDEATRSKYLKVYGKHKVGSDESKMNLARLKRDMAMLQRGGADAETMKKAAAASGRFNRNEKPDPSYNPNDAAMAGYRFASKATRSFDAAKKSPRKAAVSEANASKADKVYRKFGHGTEHDLAQLKRQVGVLRRGGASDETIRKFPKIAAKGGSHNQAEITTARANFMARGMRKRDQGIKSPRKTDVSEGMELDEGFMRKGRLLRARTSGKTRTPAQRKALDTAYDSELGRRVARKLRKGGATKATMRSFINTDKPTTAAADRAFKKYNEAEWKKHRQLLAKGVHPKRLGFAESTKISEGSLGMKKGIRLGRAVRQKGHTNLGKRMDAAELRSFSKTRAEVGLDPRINVIPPKYKPSDAEYAAMQGHAEKRRKGINKKYGIDESISKKYKKTKKTAKRVLKKLRKALSTPRDAVDVMITGRNF